MLSPLCSYGHLASHAELLEHERYESALLPFRLGYGLVRHPRPNLYLCAHLGEAESTAAICGGRLDCVSALSAHGLLEQPPEVHVRLRPGDGRSYARRRRAGRDIIAHWSRTLAPMPTLEQTRRAAWNGLPLSRVVIPLDEALRQAMRTCLNPVQSVAVVAALLTAGLDADRLGWVVAHTSRRVRDALTAAELPEDVASAAARLGSGRTF